MIVSSLGETIIVPTVPFADPHCPARRFVPSLNPNRQEFYLFSRTIADINMGYVTHDT